MPISTITGATGPTYFSRRTRWQRLAKKTGMDAAKLEKSVAD
jgi:hypothetical protein